MDYIIDDDFGSVPDGHQYEIKDTPEAIDEWRALLAAFTTEFSEFTAADGMDFAVADSHYETRSIFACLYNEGFYNEKFIPRVQGVLRNQTNPSFAQFECFDGDLRLLGCLMVFKDKVSFDRKLETNGIVGKLVAKT
ncbi:MAG: hypothetical protein P4M10_06095 [Verrucomicrobiae bacterium]|nr:hypothetical protein [Verrucomicrobiae bacterium]